MAKFGEIMKRSYMLAILAATSVLGASANAQTSTSAPEQASMFVIATPAPGVVDFKGTGSATFTNTQSATESVTVGSNSSFGVTVSGTNTSDYTSNAAASLKLDDSTSLNHATGTASNAFALRYATDASGSMISTDPSGALVGDTTAKISSVLTTSNSGGMTEALESALSGSFAYQADQKAIDVVGDSADDTDGGSSGIIYYGDRLRTTRPTRLFTVKSMPRLTLPLARLRLRKMNIIWL